jgi:hypothetical protein
MVFPSCTKCKWFSQLTIFNRYDFLPTNPISNPSWTPTISHWCAHVFFITQKANKSGWGTLPTDRACTGWVGPQPRGSAYDIYSQETSDFLPQKLEMPILWLKSMAEKPGWEEYSMTINPWWKMVRLQGVNRHPLEFVGISIAITGRTNFLIRNLEEIDRHGIFNIRTPKHVFS